MTGDAPSTAAANAAIEPVFRRLPLPEITRHVNFRSPRDKHPTPPITITPSDSSRPIFSPFRCRLSEAEHASSRRYFRVSRMFVSKPSAALAISLVDNFSRPRIRPWEDVRGVVINCKKFFRFASFVDSVFSGAFRDPIPGPSRDDFLPTKTAGLLRFLSSMKVGKERRFGRKKFGRDSLLKIFWVFESSVFPRQRWAGAITCGYRIRNQTIFPKVVFSSLNGDVDKRLGDDNMLAKRTRAIPVSFSHQVSAFGARGTNGLDCPGATISTMGG